MAYTKADNWLFDVVMPAASPNTFKIVAAVVRMTAGWHRKEARLTYDDLYEMTGIGSRSTLTNAIDEALEAGWISRKKEGRYLLYRPVCSTETVLESSTDSVPEADPAVQKLDHERYRNCTADSTDSVPPSNKEKKEEKKGKYINGRERVIGGFAPEVIDPEPEEPPKPSAPAPVLEMAAAIASVAREPYGAGVNEERYHDLAYTFLGYDYTPEQVRGFREWWDTKAGERGYYSGPPALTSVQNRMSVYVDELENGPPVERGPKPKNADAMEYLFQIASGD